MGSSEYEIIRQGSGTYTAKYRNEALKDCKAKYVIFGSEGVDFDEGMAELMMAEMEESGAGLVVCGYDIMDPGTEDTSTGNIETPASKVVAPPEDFEIYYETPEFNRRVMDREDMLCRIFYQTHYQGFVWNKMFRTGVIKKKRIHFDTDIPGSEDMLFLVNYIRNVKSAVILPQHMCHVHSLPEADFDHEVTAYNRMKKKLWRYPDAKWLCEQSLQLLQEELMDA